MARGVRSGPLCRYSEQGDFRRKAVRAGVWPVPTRSLPFAQRAGDLQVCTATAIIDRLLATGRMGLVDWRSGLVRNGLRRVGDGRGRRAVTAEKHHESQEIAVLSC